MPHLVSRHLQRQAAVDPRLGRVAADAAKAPPRAGALAAGRRRRSAIVVQVVTGRGGARALSDMLK